MSDDVPDRELAALESALKGLAPAGSFDRDRLFFRAGQASARGNRWPWAAATAVLAVVTCTLGTLLALRPGPQAVERVVYVRVPAQEPAPQPPPPEQPPPPQPQPSVTVTATAPALPGDYLRLRDQVLRWGVETLPEPAPFPGGAGPARPMTLLDMLSAKS